MRYTVKQTLVPRNVTMGTKLRGAQSTPELALRSTEFRSPENLIFSALFFSLLTKSELFGDRRKSKLFLHLPNF